MNPELVTKAAGLIGSGCDAPVREDYVGGNDLLYCGKCNTPKQFVLPSIPGLASAVAGHTVPVPCACEKERQKEQERKDEAERQMMRMYELRRASLMDAKFEDAKFSKFTVNDENKRQHKACKRYAEAFSDMASRNQGLLMLGEVGTGKSFAAGCIANALMERMIPVVMTSFVKLISVSFDRRSESEEEIIHRLNNAHLLIIDDLGAERATDYALERVYNIVDSRYRACKPMIITTNLTLGQMQKCDDIRQIRIYDRILETCYPLVFTGKSWRIQKAAKRYREMGSLLMGDDVT